MKQRFVSLMILLALPLFMCAQKVGMAMVPADTAKNACDRHYEAAIKFLIDTPILHPFSVTENTKVIFSRGNLQYCPARDEWRFALNQHDRVGNGMQANPPAGTDYATVNKGITTVFYDSIDYSTKDATTSSGYKEIHGVPCNNSLISENYEGWIDLYSWGTSGHGKRVKDAGATYFYPYELNNENVVSYNVYGFGPSFGNGHGPGALTNDIDTNSGTNRWFDWGYGNYIREYNPCSHPTTGPLSHARDSTMYLPAVWRTLTGDEWLYLLTKRVVSGNDSAFTYVRLKYGDNATDTVTGLIIYPDDFIFSEADVAILPFGPYSINEIDADTWAALERVGCIFLPGSSSRKFNSGNPIIKEQEYGIECAYWSATASSVSQASAIRFAFREKQISKINDTRSSGFLVRLVQDVK